MLERTFQFATAKRSPLLLAATLLIATSQGSALAETKKIVMHHATGTFTVKITPEASEPAGADHAPTSRFGLLKTFSGALQGTAHGTMMAIGTPAPGSSAAYVALDQFTGSLDGRSGGFVLVHRGTMKKNGETDLEVIIAPDSGTGALAGVSGELTIKVVGGEHHYDLAYQLPDGA